MQTSLSKLPTKETKIYHQLVRKISELNKSDLSYKSVKFSPQEARVIRLRLLYDKTDICSKLEIMNYDEWTNDSCLFSKFSINNFNALKQLILLERKKGLNTKSTLLNKVYSLQEENNEYQRATFSVQEASMIDSFLQEQNVQELRDLLLKENVNYLKIISRNSSRITNILDLTTQVQLLNSLKSMLSKDLSSLLFTKVRDLYNMAINFPGLANYLEGMSKDYGVMHTTNWYSLFCINFISNMKGVGIHGVIARQDTNIINLMATFFSLNGYNSQANYLLSILPTMRNVILLSTVARSFYTSMITTGDLCLDNYIDNLKDKLKHQLNAFGNGLIDENSKSFKVIMTQVCCDLKHILRCQNSADKRHLYFRVLFLQHYFQGTISISTSRSRNSLFEALSYYTEESAEQLSKISDGAADLARISTILDRSIIVIYGKRESILSHNFLFELYNIGRQDFIGVVGSACKGDPIFILLDERNQYQGLTLDTEGYFVRHVSKKLKKGENSFASVACGLFSNTNKPSQRSVEEIIRDLQSHGINLPDVTSVRCFK